MASLLVCLIFALSLPTISWAQQNKEATLADALTARLNQIEATLEREGLSDEELNEQRAKLVEIQDEAIAKRDELQPKLQEASARLEALKPAESKGEDAKDSIAEESEALIQRRSELTKQVSDLDAELKLVTASLVRVDQLNNKITLARQLHFTTQLFERSSSLTNPLLWAKGLSGLGETWKATRILVSDWFSYISDRAADKIWQILGMIALAAVVIIGPLRLAMISGISRLARLDNPSAFQKSLHASWAILVYTAVPFLSLLAFVLILENAELLPGRIKNLAELLAVVVFLSALSYGLVRVLLAPRKPSYRLLNLSDADANRLYGLALGLLCVFIVEAALDQSSSVLLIPLETTILIRGLTAIIIGILIWVGLRMVIASKPARERENTDDTDIVRESFSLPGFIRIMQPIIWLCCLVIFIAPLLGYVSFAGFVAEQLGRIFIVLALLGILSALIDNLLMEALDLQKNSTQQISKAMGIRPRAIGQFSVLFNGLIRILLYIAAALLIFAPWGVESSDFLTSMRSAIFNIKIGDLNISPINIIGAIIVFIITLVLVKSVQRWVERRLMPSTGLDTGLKNSALLPTPMMVSFTVAEIGGVDARGEMKSFIAGESAPQHGVQPRFSLRGNAQQISYCKSRQWLGRRCRLAILGIFQS